MNYYLFIAGVLILLIGLAHSVLGEILIFNKLRNKQLVPTVGGRLLKERNVRILWASWHLVTIFGAGLGAIVIRMAFPFDATGLETFIYETVWVSMLAASATVLYGTKARHPGWIGLLLVVVVMSFK